MGAEASVENDDDVKESADLDVVVSSSVNRADVMRSEQFRSSQFLLGEGQHKRRRHPPSEEGDDPWGY